MAGTWMGYGIIAEGTTMGFKAGLQDSKGTYISGNDGRYQYKVHTSHRVPGCPQGASTTTQ